MDNVKYYNDSLAYNFEMFMPKEKPVEKTDNVIKMPQTAKQRRKRVKAANKSVSISVSAVLICASIVAILCANIFLRARINEINTEITEANATLNSLDAELTLLNVRYEKIVSYTNLEQSAVNFGMKKMSKNQVVYIHVNDTDCAVTQSGEKVQSDNK